MSDGEALLAAVCAAPDDDLPRLAFADWCDDHGQTDRAEFVRLQCLPAPTADQRRRADELLVARFAEWTEPLAGFERVDRDPDRVRFRRGFVWAVEIDADGDDFRTWAGDLFRAAPVQRVNFFCRYAHDDLAGCAELLRLREMGTDRCAFEAENLAVLLGSPYLRNLRRLELIADDDNSHLEEEGLRQVGACLNLPALRELDLSGNWEGWQFGDEGWIDNLLAGPLVGQLTDLALRNTFMEDRSAGLIAGCDRLGRLERLDLSGNSFTAAGLRVLARSRRLASLRTLDLHGNYFSPGLQGEAAEPPEAAHDELRRRFGDGVRLGD